MEWHSPLYFWLLLVLPLVAALFYRARQQRSQLQAYFQIPHAVQQAMTRRRLIKAVAVVLATGLIVLALARPRVGGAEREVEQRGLDLVVALDLSHSMLAEDVAPSRLARARNEVRRVLDQLAGDRVALVVFAGTGIVQVPLTTDYAAVRAVLGTVHPDDMPAPGTNLDGALQAARHALENAPQNPSSGRPDAPPRARALLLLSDGDFRDTHVAQAAEQTRDIAVFTAGVGTPAGGRIPQYDDEGNRTGWMRSDTGAPITTQLHRDALQRLITSPGTYYELGPASGSLDSFVDDLRPLERSLIGMERFDAYYEWFVLPLALALGLLLIDTMLPVRLSAPSSSAPSDLPVRDT